MKRLHFLFLISTLIFLNPLFFFSQEKKSTVVAFRGNGIKCEIEDMDLDSCQILEDESSSGKSCVEFGKQARASIKIRLPKGRYEILFSQKAFQTKGSKFVLQIGDKEYTAYPSEPPLGTWEYTTRCPVVYENEKPGTLTLTIQTKDWDNLSSNFFLDFLQIVKI